MTANESKTNRERINKFRASAALKIIENGQPAEWLAISGLMNKNGADAVGRIILQYSIDEIKSEAGV